MRNLSTKGFEAAKAVFNKTYVEKDGPLKAALSAYVEAVGGEPAQTSAVRVKGLEWNERGFAHTGTGIVYRVICRPGFWRLEKIEGSSTLNSAHPNEEHAKAAAQADYERRIRSALEAETGGGEKIDVRQAIRDIESGKTLGFVNYGDHAEEVDNTDINCPYCGGSGHKGDVATTTDERVVEAQGPVPIHECEFRIGQSVHLANPYPEQDPNIVYFVTGIAWEHRFVSHRGWNIAIATAEELSKGHGQTDGFRPSDLRAALAQGESRNG